MRRLFSFLTAAMILAASSALIAGDLPLRTDSSGQGEPTIVLLHGAGSDISTWDLVVPALSQAHRVVRVELPGHGASPMIPVITVKDVARAVDRALEREHVEHALLVGHSYGAWVALEEAAARPNRVSAVVVLDMGSYTPQDSARIASLDRYIALEYQQLIHVIFETMSAIPAESDSAVAQALRVPRDVLTAYLRDSWRTDLRPRIKKLKTPIHMIATDGSWPAAQPWDRARLQLGYETAGTVEGYRISGSGHLMMRDRPDTLAALVLGIADKVPRR